MAHRYYTVLTASDTNFHQVYQMIIDNFGIPTVASGIIIPPKISQMTLQGKTGAITIGDAYAPTSTTGVQLGGGVPYTRTSNRNSIDLREYYIAANNVAFNLDFEWN